MRARRRFCLPLGPAAATLALACGAPAPTSSTPPAGTAATARAAPATPAVAAPLSLAQAGIQVDWMDPTADPCHDFFAYACGGFVKKTSIPSDRAHWGTTETIEKQNEEFLRSTLERAARDPGADAGLKKLGDYYAACMDEAAIERAGVSPIAPLLSKVAAVKDFATLADAVATLHEAGVYVLFDVTSQQDFKDATQMIAGLDQNGLGLPDRDYYLKDEGNTKDVRAFYKNHVATMLSLADPHAAAPADARAKAGGVGMSRAAVRAAEDVLRIETALARLQQDKVTRRDPYKVYHRVERDGLARLAPKVPWDAYFKTLGFPDIRAISVSDEGYFKGVEALMQAEKPEAWRSYLTWHVVRSKAGLLTGALVDASFALRRKLTGQKELEPRWKRCVHATDAGLGELLAQPFLAAKFGGDSKAQAQALTLQIHDAMKQDLEQVPWMDDATRGKALEKLAKMGAKVGFPDRFRTYEFPVTRGQYADNAMAASRFERRRRLAKVGKPVDRGDWEMTPPTVNAYYDPSLNEIVLPAGELLPPFFSKDFYPPVNIGNEGANTIGHEITHGFDDEGSQFDGDGNLRDWWTPETKAKFVASTRCVQEQYSAYEAVPGVHLDGELTSGENIADIGGVKLGFEALVAWKKAHPDAHRAVEGTTDEKLFFLAYAQGWCSKETPEFLEMLARTNPHSPPRFRVNGPMADTAAFADAYACGAGAPMNPPRRCAVW